ncbi:MAG: SRPBCC family protein [Opitutae bacterium]|nr:SRPBCC family protein [Opitutae bacterium]
MSPSRLRVFGFLAAGCLASVTAAAAELTPEDWAKIARGDVIVRSLPAGEAAAGRVWAAVLIPAPVSTVWNVMLDVEHAPEFVPGLRRARRIERHGPSEIIEHTVKYSWLLPEVTYRFRADYRPQEQIDFQRISGDLRALTGTWTLRPTPDGTGTVVTYSVMLDPGFLVPQWLVRQSLAHNLPAVLRATRQRATAPPPSPAGDPRPR